MAEELGLKKNVFFLGFVSIDELVALYQNAFALVFASFFGPDNIPPLEAFALGCPVISAKFAGAEDQLKGAALLFDPKSEHELAATIKKLYDNPVLKSTIINKGKQKAAHWTSLDYVNKISDIFDEFEPIRRCWSSNEPYEHK